jgi:putative ABC transport system substrate-binding protein
MRVTSVGLLGLLILTGLLVAPRTPTAQPRGTIPLVGWLRPEYPPDPSHPSDISTLYLQAFRQGFHDLGYVERQTIRLEYRYTAYQWDRLPALAAELIQLQPAVLVVTTTRAAVAAKQATTTIPIVVAVAGDLVEAGIVESLARPGGNITGQILGGVETEGKRLEMLKEAAPTITHVAVLVDATNPVVAKHYPSAFEREARALGVRLQRVDAGTPEAIDAALATVADSGANALLIQDSSMFNAHRQHILDVARAHRLPTVCGVRVYGEAGCLIAYAPDILAMLRRAAVFVDKILKGTKPADLPVELPTKFELVLNLKTAQALGITVPPTLLFQANEVIR